MARLEQEEEERSDLRTLHRLPGWHLAAMNRVEWIHWVLNLSDMVYYLKFLQGFWIIKFFIYELLSITYIVRNMNRG